MAATLQTDILVQLAAHLQSVLDLATVDVPATVRSTYSWPSGTGLDQADLVFTDTRTLTASSTESLDLAGSLVDASGATLTFARVKAILIRAAAGNTNNVNVGGAASNGFVNWVADPTDIVIVRPGGLFLLIAHDATGYAVTASTGDLLKIANSSSGTSVTYDIVIIGCSA